MGSEVYGSIENAFNQMLEDIGKISDKDMSSTRAIYRELMGLVDDIDYKDWITKQFDNPNVIRRVGGRFVFPDEIPALIKILDDRLSRSDA
jgi:hypothetical protein